MTQIADPVGSPVQNRVDPAHRAATNGNGHTPARAWTLDDSAKLYTIRDWGQGYFAINDKGHVAK